MIATTSAAGAAQRARKRRRRRLAVWGALAIAGLALGAVYADSIPSIGGSNGSVSATGSDGFASANPGGSNSPFSSLVTAGSDLSYTWSGKNGSFASDQTMFMVDATQTAAAGKTFQLDIVLTNTVLTGNWTNWDGGGPQLMIAEKTITSGTCSSPQVDFDTGTVTTTTVKFDTTDANVTFGGISDNAKKYCFGVGNYTGNGKDVAGTFLRRLDSSFTPTYPTFAGVISRTA
jgi:hypothetical protein